MTARPDASPATASPAAPGRRCRVVAIDDERIGRVALSAVLAAERCDAVVVGTPAELEDAVRTHRPDLVILDLMMPGEDGFALCRRLREDPANAGIVVLIVTALDEDDAMTAATQEAGADGFLSKPLRRDLLREWQLRAIR